MDQNRAANELSQFVDRPPQYLANRTRIEHTPENVE